MLHIIIAHTGYKSRYMCVVRFTCLPVLAVNNCTGTCHSVISNTEIECWKPLKTAATSWGSVWTRRVYLQVIIWKSCCTRWRYVITLLVVGNKCFDACGEFLYTGLAMPRKHWKYPSNKNITQNHFVFGVRWNYRKHCKILNLYHFLCIYV